MTAPNLITFTNGANSVIVTAPQWNYTTSINMVLTHAEKSDSTVGIYDQGVAYDVRYCKCNFLLNATDMALFIAFFSDSTKGRGEDVTLSVCKGFFPFGPDKGDQGDFVIRMTSFQQTGQLFRPWKWYEVECLMAMTTAPAYTLPDQIKDGTFQVGTVLGLRPPQDSFASQVSYALNDVITHGGAGHEIDKGTSADGYRTSMLLSGNQTKMAALVKYVAQTARASNFTITSQTGHLPFGKAKGDGLFTVQMLNKGLTINHLHHDRFQMDLNLNYISGPA